MKMTQKLGAKGAFASTVNNKNLGCDTKTTVPSGGAGFAKSTAQKSGKTIHGRSTGANIAGSDGSLKGMPTVHYAGGTDTRKVDSSLKGFPSINKCC